MQKKQKLLHKRMARHFDEVSEKKPNLPTIAVRREFLIGTASLALASVLPGCSQTPKNVQTQTTASVISALTDIELSASCS